MATDRQNKLFPTAGEAHRYCQSHGLDISMVNNQLWDIAEALHNASQRGATTELGEQVSMIDDLSLSFLSVTGGEGIKLTPSDQAMLKKADEIISRYAASGETCGFTAESIVDWAQDVEDRHGLENQAGNVEELLADAILEAWEWIRVNERGQHHVAPPSDLYFKVENASKLIDLIVKETSITDARNELDGLRDVMEWLSKNK